MIKKMMAMVNMGMMMRFANGPAKAMLEKYHAINGINVNEAERDAARDCIINNAIELLIVNILRNISMKNGCRIIKPAIPTTDI